jgi:hypothetical protein
MSTGLFVFNPIVDAVEEEKTAAEDEKEELQRRFPNQFIPTSAFFRLYLYFWHPSLFLCLTLFRLAYFLPAFLF